MALLYEIRRRAWQVAPQVIFACVFGYFAYHAVHGDRGITAWVATKDEIVRAKAERERVAAARADIENHVNLLRAEHLDPDMLDERARLLLNMGREDEIIVLFEPR